MPPNLAARAWLMWGLGALYYAYAFFQRVAPSVMVEELMRDFAIDGAMLGGLSAAYFYAYAAVQIPVGVLLDRLGPRYLLAAAASAAALGGFVFASAAAPGTALAGRVLVGLGAGFAYISALKIASSWFPPARFGLAAGLTLAAGTLGAVGAQVPLAVLIAWLGWRTTMLLVAAAGLGLALLMLLLVRDSPDAAPAAAARGGPGLLAGLRSVIVRGETWLLALTTGLLGAPILAFAGLWGVPYLVQVKGLSRTEAGLVTSAVLAAWAVGGPCCGWLSDRLGRRPVLVGGAALMGLLWLPILLRPGLPVLAQAGCLVGIGLAGGAMIVAFAAARDRFGHAQAGSALGVVNTSVLLFGAAMQTLIGRVLDLGWQGQLAAGARVYGPTAYRLAFLVFPLAAAVAGVAALLMPAERRGDR